MEASESQDLRPGSVVGGKYQIEGTLGSGGTAVVFSATQSDLQRLVAIKVIRRELMERPDAVSRLMSEATTVARIKGEHAARIVDVGQLEDGCPYIVMEHFDGSDLASLLQVHGAAPPERVVEWVLQASVALAEAHSLGTIHRDLKPQNIFLANTPKGEPMVKVLDFGIAAGSSSRSTEVASTGEFKRIDGSPLYMSPEQMQGLPEDDRSDIWGLGVLMFELLTQKLPFPGDTFEEICKKALSSEVPLHVLRDEHVPADLVEVIGRCLRREPAERYADVVELAQALEPLASAEGGRCVRAIEQIAEGSSSPPVVAAWSSPSTSSTGVDRVESNPSVPPRRRSRPWWPALVAAGALASLVLWLIPRSGAHSATEALPLRGRSVAAVVSTAVSSLSPVPPGQGGRALAARPATAGQVEGRSDPVAATQSPSAATQASVPSRQAARTATQGATTVVQGASVVSQAKLPAPAASSPVARRRSFAPVGAVKPPLPEVSKEPKTDPTRAWRRDAFGSRK